MMDTHEHIPEQRFIAEGKHEREKSISSIVYDTLSQVWDRRNWDDVTYVQMEVLFRSAYDQGCTELGVDEMPHKLASEYQTQLIREMINQIPIIMDSVDEEDLGDVYEHLANALPNAKVEILAQSLRSLDVTERQKLSRTRLARLLIETDPQAYLELESYGFSQTEQIELARRVAGKEGLSLFEFVNSLGETPSEEFVKAVLEQMPGQIVCYAEFANLSSEEISRMMHTAKPESQSIMKAELGVPATPEKKSAHQFIRRNKFDSFHPIELERIQKTEDALHRAIEQDYPKQKQEQQKRREDETRLRGTMERVGELGSDSLNAPLICYFEGHPDLPVIYKPQRREQEADMMQVPAGTYAKREWLAYQIDQALQIPTIATTVLRDGPEGIGSVKEWVIARTACATKNWETRANKDQLEDLVFDDVIKENEDGHDENFLVGFDGSVVGIDYGMILSTEPDPYIESVPGHLFSRKTPSKRVVDRIHQYQNATNVQSALFHCFHAALGNQFDIAWDRFQGRLRELAPMNGEGRYPWMGMNSLEDEEEVSRKKIPMNIEDEAIQFAK